MTNNNIPYRPLELMLDPNMTRFDCQDFIAVWENFVPISFCNQLIEYFKEQVDNNGSLYLPTNVEKRESLSYQKGEHQYDGALRRKDEAILLNYADNILAGNVNQFLMSCTQHYVHIFDQLRSTGLLSSDIKFQRTKPGGGYHLWHYEAGALSHAARELVWMIYLNDLPDGEGETEFLYQRRRIKPTAGTVVIFPAGMTHVHKGNTVFTEDKYIVTGWHIKAQ